MRDKRPVDELSIEELERILAVRKREARQQRLQRMQRDGRLIAGEVAESAAVTTAALVPANGAPMPAPRPSHEYALAPVPAAPHFDDGVPAYMDDGLHDSEAPAVTRRRNKRVMDRVLVLVEVVAVLTIAVIGIRLVSTISFFENETASAQQQAEELRRAGIPTAVPTPSLRLEDYVLPGGHTVTADGVQFNYEEVPPQLVGLVEAQWIRPVVARPQTTSETALTLVVPDLNLNQSIVQGVDLEALAQGVGQLPNGVNPGDETGNVVLAAHNDVYSELFRHLDQLQPGDQFQIQTQSGAQTYVITNVFTTTPDDVSVLASRGRPTATLISCYPYQVNSQRIIVYADRVA
jgi:sortase A